MHVSKLDSEYNMFDGPDYPKSLDESLFDTWLAQGRDSKIGYHYLLVIWNALEDNYEPVYIENRASINTYEMYGDSTSHESLVAVYDLYSESRISISN